MKNISSSTLYTVYILIAERRQSLFSSSPSLHLRLYFTREVDVIKKSAGNHRHPHLLAFVLWTQQHSMDLSYNRSGTRYEPWICTFVCLSGCMCTYSRLYSFHSNLRWLSCRGNTGGDGGWRCLHTWTLACFWTQPNRVFNVSCLMWN